MARLRDLAKRVATMDVGGMVALLAGLVGRWRRRPGASDARARRAATLDVGSAAAIRPRGRRLPRWAAGAIWARRVVTLDVDSAAIRLVEVVGRRLRRWATAALEPGLVENGIILDPEAVGSRIRELMQRSGIRASSVVASVGGSFAIARTIALPRPEGVALEAQVLEAAQEISPVPLEQLYLTWRQVADEGKTQEFLLVGVHRSVVNYHLAALRAAGLKPRSLNIRTLAVAAAAAQRDALVLNVEQDTVELALVLDGIPRVLHTATLPPESKSLEVWADQVFHVLARAVGFYDARHQGEPLADAVPVLLAGQRAADPDLARRLAELTGRTVAPLDPPVEHPGHMLKAQWGVNIGLALRKTVLDGYPSGNAPFSLNLLERPRGRARFTRRKMLAALAIAAGLVGAFLLFGSFSQAQDAAAALQAERDALQARVQSLQQTLARRSGLQQVVKEFDELSALRRALLQDWELLEESAGPDIRLNTLTFSQAGVAMQVTAPSLNELEGFVEALRELPRFSRVDLPSETGGGEEGQPVTLGVATTFAPRQQK